ncbi:MAG: heavy-metal-associated domain-containing protein [Anaerolineae bacterium]|nr:heavy-metal-associated domain-containing protein [Anaerolineae bacterium]
MESVVINLPTMFADHHVLKVRDVLFAVDGVDDVFASSAWHSVIIQYDPEKTEIQSLHQALSAAGYQPDQPTPILATLTGTQFKDPAWADSGPRVTRTDEVDAKMSKLG